MSIGRTEEQIQEENPVRGDKNIHRRWYSATCLYVLYRFINSKPLRFESDETTSARINKIATVFLLMSFLFGVDFSISLAEAVEDARFNSYISSLPMEVQIKVIGALPLEQLIKINMGG